MSLHLAVIARVHRADSVAVVSSDVHDDVIHAAGHTARSPVFSVLNA